MLPFWFGSLLGSKTPFLFGTNVEREIRSPSTTPPGKRPLTDFIAGAFLWQVAYSGSL